MPKRTRFVRAEKIRIPLVDVHRRLHQDLISKGVLLPKKNATDPDTYRPATAEELAASHARVEDAEEAGDWIDVKKALNAGETRDLYIDLIKGGELHQGEKPILDPSRVGITNILAYLLGWSFVDEEGTPMPYSVLVMSEDERLETLKRLSPEDYQELDTAIDQHVAAMAAEKEAAKNGPRITSISAATS